MAKKIFGCIACGKRPLIKDEILSAGLFDFRDNRRKKILHSERNAKIPYRQKIGDAVKILGNELIDFEDAVFGRNELWVSRVYFEDKVYKIGKSKPFGLGSVRITPKFYIERDTT